jgi:hypothetical protein
VWGDLVLAHLLAPALILLGVMLAVAVATGAVTTSADALAVAAITLVPAALAAVVGAAISVVIGAPPPSLYLDVGFPELTTLWLVRRQVLGPLVVIAAFVPLAVGQNASVTGQSAAGAAVATALLPVVLVVGGALWMRSREAVTR